MAFKEIIIKASSQNFKYKLYMLLFSALIIQIIQTSAIYMLG